MVALVSPPDTQPVLELALLNRIVDLPLVQVAVQQAASLYDHTKSAIPLLGTTLNTTESALKTVASRAQPLVQRIAPQISVVDRFACSQFAKIENKYPAIKASPEEVIDFGKRRYDQSYLKKTVDTIVSAKDFGYQKINQTKQLWNDTLTAIVSENKQMDLEKLLNFSQHLLSSGIEYADSLIDKYIPVDDNDYYRMQSAQASGNLKRLQTLSSKLAHGVNQRAVHGYSSTKDTAMMLFHQAAANINLMGMLGSLQNFINKRSTHAQEETRKALHYLRTNYDNVASTLDSTTIRLVHLIAANTSALSNQLSKYSTRYLPPNANQATLAAVNYLNDLSDTVIKAKSTGELKDGLLAEAANKVELCRKRFLEALGNAAPVSWMAISIDNLELEDDILVIDRNERLPTETVQVQPRLAVHVQMG